MEYKRKLNGSEKKLLDFLMDKASFEFLKRSKDDIMVQPMSDGGMGSLKLLLKDSNNNSRLFGKRVSECFFTDEDGVKVIASLNVDSDGHLFELDIWKTDFSPLLRIPAEFE